MAQFLKGQKVGGCFMYAKAFSAGLMGIEAYLIHVEVDIRMSQLPQWYTVGLPESAVRESKERVVAAIKNSGYDFCFRRVTINLAPANMKKEGTAHDLSMAVVLMAASETLPTAPLQDTIFVGELSLTGELRPVRGVLPIAILAKELGMQNLIVPLENAREATVVQGLAVYGFERLSHIVEFLKGNTSVKPLPTEEFTSSATLTLSTQNDFAEVYGQGQAKRALEIAACGGHNVLFSGPPGCGKTMLASRLPTILPPLSFAESLETSKIYSISGLLKNHTLMRERPFRSPHHTISYSGMIGGGQIPKPGEVSLAHNGVLFLDELPEFPRYILELLRQPVESHEVTIARAHAVLTFPSRFMLIGSCNPCPCGFLGHAKIFCRCAPQQIQKYKARLSGPFLDRFDLFVEVQAVNYQEMRARAGGETSATIAARVCRMRERQRERFAQEGIRHNAQMATRHIERHCRLDLTSEKIINETVDKMNCSARAVSRLLRVARTIADMEEENNIRPDHLLEAIQYRAWEARG